MSLSPEEWAVLGLSLRVSLVATGVGLPAAFGLAWLLARHEFPGRILLDGLVHLPLVTPPVVIGWLLLSLLGPAGAVGKLLQDVFGITLVFSWTGAALAAGVMALPLMVRAMRLSIENVDRRLENAALTLGASRRQVFLRVSLPLALPGVLAGAVLGFARSVGEFGATIAFVSNIPGETRTLSLAIYTALQTPGGEGPAMRLAVFAVALSIFALGLSEYLTRQGRRQEARHVV